MLIGGIETPRTCLPCIHSKSSIQPRLDLLLRISYNTHTMEIISSIDVLVHPDFHPIYCSRIVDSLETDLRSSWDSRTSELANNNKSALLYIAAWEQGFPESLAMQEDLDRTSRYRKILENRLVLYLNYAQPTAHQINKYFASNGLVIASDPEINIYGEYRQICVAAMDDRMSTIFPNGRRSILEDLCRSR